MVRTNSLSLPLDHSLFSDASAERIAGVDEVGRGALFGPVVAAAVILPRQELSALAAAGIADSKTLSPTQRRRLAPQICSGAIDCQIGLASVQEIDRLNILQASLLAMKRAVSKLRVQPDLCLVDGNQQIPQLPTPQRTMVAGDRRFLNIAAASILAKVWRDDLIVRLASQYPPYDLAHNKGYGTTLHRAAIREYGPCPLHRQSFRPCR